MKTSRTARLVVAWMLILILGTPTACKLDHGDPAEMSWRSATAEVSGKLAELDGLRILTLWGTPHEQGYAHGYLMAPEIVGFLDRVIEHQTWGIDSETWNGDVLPAAVRFRIAPAYLTELEAMLRGIEARAAHDAFVPALGRSIELADLVALCYVADDKRLGCSSFVAWGPMTSEGQTLVGRNMDWPAEPALLEIKETLVVRAGWTGTDDPATVSLIWPGSVGMSTAMNADGVTLCSNDAYNERDPVQDPGFYPFLLSNRTALQSARAGDAMGSMAAGLSLERSGVGRCLTVSVPAGVEGPRGFVFELDGIWSETDGTTVREPSPGEAFILATNHFRVRGEPMDCVRYEIGERALRSIEAGEAPPLTVESAWHLLTELTPSSGLSYHSVVFEPDAMRMHVRLQQSGVTAQCTEAITLDVQALFDELPETP